MANFSPEVIALAQESEKKYGVPASVTLAQYATESAYGSSWLAKNANNYFGMMASSKTTNKVWRSDRYWQVHESMADSFDKHGQLLAKPLYANATAGAKDAYEYIDKMAPIYAPESDGNSGIVALWKKIIQQNNLTQYDSGNYGGGGVAVPDSSGADSSGTLDGIAGDILSGVIKVGFVLLIAILAFVFFMTAFDLKIPNPKNLTKKAVKKTAVKKAVGE